jgi:formiminotetrahydrofolate cyclodeaminase
VLDKTATIEQFLDEAAAKKPTPGGGSVAALAGALSAAMGEMVLNYSVGKKGLEAHQDQIKNALAEFRRARGMMLEWIVEDQAAFEKLSAAKKALAQDPRQQEVIDTTLPLCVWIPRDVATTAARIVTLTEQLAAVANVYLLSDLAVCAELAMATVRTAVYNVRVNLKELSVPDREKIDKECHAIILRATESMKRAIPAIWARI